ncbi:lysozyme inhibitor LprI family protein [Methylomonas sp. 11b]|uniref:lysozyme inhibitor LprI family protein n=1 Tax=Methylomonas sp. 11b TaxID=1168169 RepID=UPI00047C854A|nr:lysozyme inhibitor LprI family protein [Methylomonas sp. 11b]
MNIAGSALDVGYCYSNEMGKADGELNEQYQRLTVLAKKVFSEIANPLLNSERAWLAFREHNCELFERNDMDNHGFEQKDCMLRMTRERIIELREIADSIESR